MVVNVENLRKKGDTALTLPDNTGKSKLPQKQEPKQVSLSRFTKRNDSDVFIMKKMGDDSVVSYGAPKPLVKPKPAMPTKQTNIVPVDSFPSISAVRKPAGRLPTYDARKVERIVKASNIYLRQFNKPGVDNALAMDNRARALYLGLKEASKLATTHRFGPENHAQLITAVREKVNTGERDADALNGHLTELVKRMYDLRKNGIDVVK